MDNGCQEVDVKDNLQISLKIVYLFQKNVIQVIIKITLIKI